MLPRAGILQYATSICGYVYIFHESFLVFIIIIGVTFAIFNGLYLAK